MGYWQELLVMVAVIGAGMSFWNNHVLTQRLKRLEDLTNNRIPDEKYDPTFSRQPEKR
ncbi:MAG: hypothetical protein Q8K32_11015 [Archangium sp.]|nr:hypothetical protein [Archangium sp.]